MLVTEPLTTRIFDLYPCHRLLLKCRRHHVKIEHMIKTQIYLTPYHANALKNAAHARRISMSEQLRELIERGLILQTNVENTAPEGAGVGERMITLADRVKKKGVRGPRDLSSRVDTYLYGSDA